MRIPLIGSIVNRAIDGLTGASSIFSKDQHLENCYWETTTNPATGKVTAYLYKRRGTVMGSSAGSGYSGTAGAVVWTGVTQDTSSAPNGVFAFLNRSTHALVLLNTLGNSVGTSISSVTDPVFLSETLISGTANLSIIATKTSDSLPHAWFFPTGGSFTEITDGDYPANQSPALTTVGNMVHMDGFAFIMTTNGKIFNSDLNSLANWSATSFLSCDSIPDGGCGLARLGNTIYAFGRGSIEPYQNAGNPNGSPLRRNGNVIISHGAVPSIGLPSIIQAADAIYFIGTDLSAGTTGVFRLTSGIQKVSTAAIDKILRQINANAGFAGSFSMGGMTHILLNIGFTSGALYAPVYCVETGAWWYMVTGTSVKWWEACLGTYAGKSYFVTAQKTNTGIYETNSNFVDDSEPFALVFLTENLDNGSKKRKTCRSFELVCDSQSTPGNTEILWSDDDYQSFNTQQNYLQTDGSAGNYASTPDSAALDITGDIQFIVYAAATHWASGAAQIIISKSNGTGNQRSYLFFINSTGFPTIQSSADGIASLGSASTVAVPFADGSGGWFKATRDVDDGSGNHVDNFYYSNDAPSTAASAIAWTQLGVTKTVAGATSIFAGTAELEVGTNGAGAGSPFAGKIYSAYVYNGIGGTLVEAFKASDAHPRSNSFTSSTSSATWTVNGNAYITTASSVDMSTDRPRLTRLGVFRRRAYKIIDGVNRPFRAEAIDVETQELAA